MSLRPYVPILASVALATLAGGASSAPTAMAGAGGPIAPLQVELGPPRCADLSGLVGGLLPLSRVATVPVTIRAAQGGPSSVPYEITVDGQQRVRGSLSQNSVTSSAVAVPDGGIARIVVTSGEQVVLDRTISARC